MIAELLAPENIVFGLAGDFTAGLEELCRRSSIHDLAARLKNRGSPKLTPAEQPGQDLQLLQRICSVLPAVREQLVKQRDSRTLCESEPSKARRLKLIADLPQELFPPSNTFRPLDSLALAAVDDAENTAPLIRLRDHN